jgi:hypothetical protein
MERYLSTMLHKLMILAVKKPVIKQFRFTESSLYVLADLAGMRVNSEDRGFMLFQCRYVQELTAKKYS